jgi:hypothetical protein
MKILNATCMVFVVWQFGREFACVEPAETTTTNGRAGRSCGRTDVARRAAAPRLAHTWRNCLGPQMLANEANSPNVEGRTHAGGEFARQIHDADAPRRNVARRSRNQVV